MWFCDRYCYAYTVPGAELWAVAVLSVRQAFRSWTPASQPMAAMPVSYGDWCLGIGVPRCAFRFRKGSIRKAPPETYCLPIPLGVWFLTAQPRSQRWLKLHLHPDAASCRVG